VVLRDLWEDMAVIPTLYCAKCTTGVALVLTLETCPACQQPTTWLSESPVPRVPFTLTKDDAHWLKQLRIGIDAQDLAV